MYLKFVLFKLLRAICPDIVWCVVWYSVMFH